MEQRCTCGAVLPNDARFCHKCGKPQNAEDIERLEAEPVRRPVQGPLEPPSATGDNSAAITFKNSRAVLTSLFVAAGAMLCFFPLALLAAPLFPLFLCAVGFVAVRFYNGRSAETLSTGAAARLGWMTGLWLFVVVVVVITLTAVFVSSQEGWEQLRVNFARAPQAAQLMKMTQHDFLIQMLITVPFAFFLLTLLPGLGGMLGAKFWARRRSS